MENKYQEGIDRMEDFLSKAIVAAKMVGGTSVYTYIKFDYTPDDIKNLDAAMKEKRKRASLHNEDGMPKEVIVMFGLYFGEILKRAFNGKWKYDDVNDIINYELDIVNNFGNGGQTVYPIKRAFKSYEDKEYTLQSMYDSLSLFNNPGKFKEYLKTATVEQDGWIKLPDGNMVRAMYGELSDKESICMACGKSKKLIDLDVCVGCLKHIRIEDLADGAKMVHCGDKSWVVTKAKNLTKEDLLKELKSKTDEKK